MPDTIQRVIQTIEVKPLGNLAAPFETIRRGASGASDAVARGTQQNQQAFSQATTGMIVRTNGASDAVARGAQRNQQTLSMAATGMATDLRKTDRGVMALSRGFSGLTMNIAMMSGAAAQADGPMGKMAQHAQVAVGVIATFHSAALLGRGLLVVTTALGKYATKALVATGASSGSWPACRQRTAPWSPVAWKASRSRRLPPPWVAPGAPCCACWPTCRTSRPAARRASREP